MPLGITSSANLASLKPKWLFSPSYSVKKNGQSADNRYVDSPLLNIRGLFIYFFVQRINARRKEQT
jgi:hypothetical protein